MIRVVYHDNRHDMISVFILQLGIECRKIKMFYRNSEMRWVTVGVDPVRKAREVHYHGHERRKAHMPALSETAPFPSILF